MALKPQGCSRLLILYPLSFLRANAWSSPLSRSKFSFHSTERSSMDTRIPLLPSAYSVDARTPCARACVRVRESLREEV